MTFSQNSPQHEENQQFLVTDAHTKQTVKPEDVVVCVGDTHGNLPSVLSLWAALEKRLGKAVFEACTVVFLGDYCDRGFDTKGLLDWLVELKQSRPNTHFIAGNHDFAMAAFLGLYSPSPEGFQSACARYPHSEHLWHGPGEADIHLQGRRWGGCDLYSSSATFQSYGVKLWDRDGLLAAVPDSHKSFLRDLEWVVTLKRSYGELVFVHAGLTSDESVAGQIKYLRSRDVMNESMEQLSGRDSVLYQPPELYHSDTTVISGHHGILEIDNPRRLVVDEQAGFYWNPLAAVVLPTRDVVRSTDALK